MVFQFALTARARRTARLIAVLALLCLGGVQVLEASHAHGIADVQAECLLCKSSAPAALSAAPALPLFLVLAACVLAALRPVHIAPRYLPLQARGPPQYS
tara:strand:- start:714 stop:1013 length:300 start_codon:yes stop_codon:yes gene_type:complete